MTKKRTAICNILTTVFCLLTTFFANAQTPAWWYARGVIDPGLPAHDYSPVTLGQLKWFAVKAADEMNAYFGAGPNVMAVVNAFVDSGNYIVATVGQVKYVAQPFYDRLQQFELIHTFPPGMPGRYPWGNAPTTNDYALATIGQVKYVFSFDSAKDSNRNGLSDWQEAADRLGLSISGYVLYSGPQSGPIHVRLSANADGSGVIQGLTLSQPGVFGFDKLPTRRWYWIKAWRDSDQNGSKDSWEAQGDSDANPIYLTANVVNANIPLTDPDTDNDTLPDWWEIMWFGTTLAQGPTDDPDRDLISNQQEQHFGMDPTLTTITFGNAALVDVTAAPRPFDTTMFFPNDGCDHTGYVDDRSEFYDGNAPCKDGNNSICDVKYASSFGLFAAYQDRGFCGDQQPAEYQAKYIEYVNDVLGGSLSRSVFFEVDVLYPRFEWSKASSLETNDPGLVENAINRGFTIDMLQAANAAGTLPVLVLINGSDQYKDTDPLKIALHAKHFIDILYSNSVRAAYILGTEIPGGGFGKSKAETVIGYIRYYITNYIPQAGESGIPIGVHTQGYDSDHWPTNAQFLAYEFDWNPWAGWSKEPEEVITQAVNAMNARGNPGVHFLEYNYRVTGNAAIKQTCALEEKFPLLQTEYGNCFGFSRSYRIGSAPFDPCP